MRYLTTVLLAFAAGCVNGSPTEAQEAAFRVELTGKLLTTGRFCTYELELATTGGAPGDHALFESAKVTQYILVPNDGRMAEVTAHYSAPGLLRMWGQPGVSYGDTLRIRLPTEFSVTHEITFRLPTGEYWTDRTLVAC